MEFKNQLIIVLSIFLLIMFLVALDNHNRYEKLEKENYDLDDKLFECQANLRDNLPFCNPKIFDNEVVRFETTGDTFYKQNGIICTWKYNPASHYLDDGMDWNINYNLDNCQKVREGKYICNGINVYEVGDWFLELDNINDSNLTNYTIKYERAKHYL